MRSNDKPLEEERKSIEAIQRPLAPSSLVSQVKAATEYIHNAFDHRWFHAELIEMVAKAAARELQVWLSWANELSREMGMNIELFLVDKENFFATVVDFSVETSKAVEQRAAIYIHLGCIPRLLGLANRMVFASRASSFALAMLNGFDGSRSNTREWDPRVDPIGTVVAEENGSFEKTARVVIDSLVIMFLHEVSHVIRAHLHHPEVVKKELKLTPFLYRRAAESDADASAGWLFVAGHECDEIKAITQEVCQSNDDVIHRLSLSSVCNYVALQVFFDKKTSFSRPYHFPSTRADCILYGAKQAWLDFGGDEQEFESRVNAAYQFISRFEFEMPAALRNWIDRESPESVSDFAIYNKLTLILIDEISFLNAARRPTCIPYKLSIFSPNSFVDSGIEYTVSFAKMQRDAV